jgi:hypothetical protein
MVGEIEVVAPQWSRDPGRHSDQRRTIDIRPALALQSRHTPVDDGLIEESFKAKYLCCHLPTIRGSCPGE